MKKGFLVLLALSTLLYGCGLFGGRGTGHHGELTSVMDRPEWDQYQPLGMVYIPPGSFHMGQNDQDVNYSQVAHNKQITISAFYMDDTEITNNEYRQFVYWVRDSIAHLLIGDDHILEEGEYGERINWEIGPQISVFESEKALQVCLTI